MSDKVTPWAVLSCPEQSWAVLDHQKYYNSKYWCIADFCHYIPGAVILLILSTRLSGPSLSADCKAPRYIGNWHYPPPHPGENRTAPDYRWGLDLTSRHTPSTLRLRYHNQDEHDDDHDEVWILRRQLMIYCPNPIMIWSWTSYFGTLGEEFWSIQCCYNVTSTLWVKRIKGLVDILRLGKESW